MYLFVRVEKQYGMLILQGIAIKRTLGLTLVGYNGFVATADGRAYLYAHDANGNVAALVDAGTGEVAARYAYAAFGATLIAEGPLARRNPFRFSSEYADDETGLIYYNWRHYDPVHGAWLGRDPIGVDGGANLYAFCGNRPLDRVDNLGLEWEFSSHDGDVTVSYTLEAEERKCCQSVTIRRYVRKSIFGGDVIGDYELDHELGESEHENGITGYAEADHPDGPVFFIWRSRWTQKFKWEAVCIKGANRGRVISSVEKYYTTEAHFFWSESENGWFSDSYRSLPLILTGPYYLINIRK